jgi:PadR family transcriptional regulator PadR
MDSKLLSGTVEMLILDALSRGDNYGYQISQLVLNRSDGYFELKEGSLYPALHRLERQQLLRSFWVDSDAGRRRKYYRLTAKGNKALAARREDWSRFAQAVNSVLGIRHELV